MKHQSLTEQQFTNALLMWAKVYGWRRFHVRNSGMGGKSQVQGDKGFPDLVLVRPPRLIFAELKVGKRKLTDEQLLWEVDLLRVGLPVEQYSWRPAQWSAILKVLSR
jgi:hypothetical protein